MNRRQLRFHPAFLFVQHAPVLFQLVQIRRHRCMLKVNKGACRDTHPAIKTVSVHDFAFQIVDVSLNAVFSYPYLLQLFFQAPLHAFIKNGAMHGMHHGMVMYSRKQTVIGRRKVRIRCVRCVQMYRRRRPARRFQFVRFIVRALVLDLADTIQEMPVLKSARHRHRWLITQAHAQSKTSFVDIRW